MRAVLLACTHNCIKDLCVCVCAPYVSVHLCLWVRYYLALDRDGTSGCPHSGDSGVLCKPQNSEVLKSSHFMVE